MTKVDDGALVLHGQLPAGRPFAAVAVSLNRRRNQWHAGIVYQTGGGRPHLLHLAWDRTLLHEAIEDAATGWERYYTWIEIPLPPHKILHLAARCRSVGRRLKDVGPSLRYAVRYQGGTLGRRGFVSPNGNLGLTCATCVLALCSSVGVDLVNLGDWPVRPEDHGWISEIIRLIHDGIPGVCAADPAHAAAVAAEGLCARFRPVEVAGACLVPVLNVGQTQAVEAGQVIATRYDELLPAEID